MAAAEVYSRCSYHAFESTGLDSIDSAMLAASSAIKTKAMFRDTRCFPDFFWTLQAMDKDGNGFLDTGEFRDAMEKLGMNNITGTTVSTILTAMNIHGPITKEEFMQIVDVSISFPYCCI